MSNEKPWPVHTFVPATLAPHSCLKCGRVRGHENHQPVESIDPSSVADDKSGQVAA